MVITATSGADDPHSINNGYRAGASSPTSPTQGKKAGPGEVDPAELAFLYLVEAASTAAGSAVIRSKMLGANAVEQEKINREASQLKWNPVPTVKRTAAHSHVKTWTTWRWMPEQFGGGTDVPFHHSKHWQTPGNIKNLGTIEEVQSQNQNMFAIRGVFEDKLTVLQQSATAGETTVSTATQLSVQDMSEGSKFLDILKDLTFKAELRQPPAGS